MNADLHCHSTASDGVLEPWELAARAHQNGVSLWSLTDHDTLAGQEEAAQAARALGMTYVTGVEISALFLDFTVHIVGLNYDPTSEALQQVLLRNAQLRVARAHEIARKLEEAGFRNVLAGAIQVAGRATNLVRPHFARYLVESGQSSSMREVFDRHIGERAPCFVPTRWVSMQDAVAAIVSAGGVAVLAHPLAYRMSSQQFDLLIQRFKECGGRALEVVSGETQETGVVRELAQVARQNQLLASRGSDFHAPSSDRADLGLAAALPKQVAPIWPCLLE